MGLLSSQNESHIIDVEFSGEAYADKLKQIQDLINQTNLLVVFNGKFDLAWLRRYGIDYSHCRVFDCQLFAYVSSGQTLAYPSLNGVAESFGLGTKLDVVASEYWDKGIDTPDIPYHILREYLDMDLQLTHKVFLEQQRVLSQQSPQFKRLISLVNQDLLVLLEMEYNGLVFDFESMDKAATELSSKIEHLKQEILNEFIYIDPNCVNLGSNDHLSCLLYGGTIIEEYREANGTYKTGDKAGQTRYKVSKKEHQCPRRFEPPRGSALKKEGYYATNEETLRSIKGSKKDNQVIENLLDLGKLEKLLSTYYLGLQKIQREKDFPANMIHGQFNQCVARTGRLSSSSPNLQNFPPEIDNFTISRYV